MPKVKNMLDSGLSVGSFDFKSGEVKEIENIKDGFFPGAIKRDFIKVLDEEPKVKEKQLRVESADIATKADNLKDKVKEKIEKFKLDSKKQVRLDSDERSKL